MSAQPGQSRDGAKMTPTEKGADMEQPTGQSYRVTLAERPTRILAFLAEHGPTTAARVSHEVTHGVSTYSGGLALLRELGLVEPDTHWLPPLWRLTAEGERLVAQANEKECR